MDAAFVTLTTVVLYPYSTSNHNMILRGAIRLQLSYILILHQTTTMGFFDVIKKMLSYILILHQTTTSTRALSFSHSCLISLFYIKPQLISMGFFDVISCLISLFYIKPQHHYRRVYRLQVVLYPYSTSNHNTTNLVLITLLLSYILILHQTTTI